jgi:hypothetical protein
MKTTLKIIGIALLIVQLFSACSNDDLSGLTQNALTNVPNAPKGDRIQYFVPGSTVSEIKVEGENIKWYILVNSYVDEETVNENNLTSKKFVTISKRTFIENGKTYYATQTINSIESVDFLPITTYFPIR